MSKFEPATLAYTLTGFAQASGIGTTRLREDIKSGKLIARKNGAKFLITLSEGRQYINSLPVAESSTDAKGV